MRGRNHAMQAGFCRQTGVAHDGILHVPGNANLPIHYFLAGTRKLCHRDNQRDMQ
ncbi:hypothetical protein D3C80_1669370 [compost metagenome]